MRRIHSAPHALSLVVPFLDAGRWLPITVPSLLAQSTPIELVFVDDGSTDDSAARLSLLLSEHEARTRSLGHRVRVMRLRENQGRSVARNTGVSASQAPLVAFVDADVALPPDWAAQQVEAHERYGAVAVVPRRVPLGLDPTDDFHRYLRRKEGAIGARGAGAELPWKQFVTAAVTVRRRAFLEVNGFDPAISYGEDTDLGLRLGAAHPRGLRLHPGNIAYHHDPDTLERALANFSRFGRRDLPALLERHHSLHDDTASAGTRGALARTLAQLVPPRLIRGVLPHLPASLHTLGVRGLCLRALQAPA